MAYGTNEAYDLSLFEERPRMSGASSSAVRKAAPLEVKKPKDNVLSFPKTESFKKNKGQILSYLAKLVVGVVIFSMVVSYIYGQVRITELTNEITEIQSTYNEQTGITTQLEAKEAMMYSMESIKEVASDELGMRKASKNQISYFSVCKDDKGEVIQQNAEKGFFENLFSGVKEFLS